MLHDKEVEHIINKAIDEFINKSEGKKKKKNIFYPSELPMCMRKNYYKRLNPISYPESLFRIFEVGNLLHDFLTKVLDKSYDVYLLNSERSLTIIADEDLDIDIHGRLDNLVYINRLDKKSGESEKLILEAKAVSSVKNLTKPHKHHIEQLIPYLRAYQMKKGYLVYLDKDNLQVKVFPVKYDEKIFRNLVRKAKKLNEHLRNNELPPPEGRKSSWECGYCKYREMCDEEFNPAIDGDWNDYKIMLGIKALKQ